MSPRAQLVTNYFLRATIQFSISSRGPLNFLCPIDSISSSPVYREGFQQTVNPKLVGIQILPVFIHDPVIERHQSSLCNYATTTSGAIYKKTIVP